MTKPNSVERNSADSDRIVPRLPILAILFVLAVDYMGLDSRIGLIGALRMPIIIVSSLFLYTVVKGPTKEFFSYLQPKLIVVFILLTFLALFHGLVGSYAIPILKAQVGYFMLVLAFYFFVDYGKTIDVVTRFLVLVHVVLVVINLDKFGGARATGFNAGYFLGDGNDFAWSLDITLPFAFYWVLNSRSKLMQLTAVGCIGIILLGITGSASRGAFLALISMTIYFLAFIIKSKSKGLVILVMIALVGVALAPEGYFERMDTIQNYEEDTSATGRLRAWRRATEMAIDHPILGVGAGSYSSAYGRFYRRLEEGDPARWVSTHSIYFKVLSEYSFFGLAIYLSILFSNLRLNRRSAEYLSGCRHRVSIRKQWPKFLNMSIIGFMIAGAFLTGVNYIHIYLLTALTLATHKIVRRECSVEDPLAVRKTELATTSRKNP